MKLLSIFLLSFLLLTGQPSLAEESPAAGTAEGETLFLDNDLKIVPVSQNETDPLTFNTIHVNYPQISGSNLSAAAQQFNLLIQSLVNKNVQQFKDYVKADMPHMQTLPDSVKVNHLQIDYDIDAIKPADNIIISARIAIEGMQAGRAHPFHRHEVLNFDLTHGKVLSLNDIFKAGSNYLSTFADYANKQLTAKLNDKWMINQGTAPNAANYKLWTLENNGIVITFDEYQVAPYADGSQEVNIPFSVLKEKISSKAVILPCVKDPESCGVD